MWRILLLTVITMSGAMSSLSYAADKEVAPEEPTEVEGAEGEDATAFKKSIYIPIKPALVVNYGGAGRLKYIKADISIRLGNSSAANSVRHHMPFIRNNLVMLFAAQTDESIGSQDGKEALRKEALEEVRQVLITEDRQEGVVDLYFNNFLVQK